MTENEVALTEEHKSEPEVQSVKKETRGRKKGSTFPGGYKNKKKPVETVNSNPQVA